MYRVLQRVNKYRTVTQSGKVVPGRLTVSDAVISTEQINASVASLHNFESEKQQRLQVSTISLHCCLHFFDCSFAAGEGRAGAAGTEACCPDEPREQAVI
jgi:hypothetical protein